MLYVVEEKVHTLYPDPEMGSGIATYPLFVTDSKEFADKYVDCWTRPQHDISEDRWVEVLVGKLRVTALPVVEPEFLNLSPKDICGDRCYWTELKEESR